jgi:hypothetical protein
MKSPFFHWPVFYLILDVTFVGSVDFYGGFNWGHWWCNMTFTITMCIINHYKYDIALLSKFVTIVNIFVCVVVIMYIIFM